MIATFDVGTNTVLASVVERSERGDVLVSDRAEITRLGRDLDRTGILSDAAIARTLAALEALAAEARASGATFLAGVGTSALRDAQNRDSFVEPARRILDRFDVIEGAREAALTFGGAFFGLPWPDGEVTVVDIGGGSTELVRGRAGVVLSATSVNVGSVRLYERHLVGSSGRPDPARLAAVRADVDRTLDALPIRPPLVMLAGTATNVAAVALGRDLVHGAAVPHGETVSREALAEAVARITRATTEERRAMPGIELGREDVILTGAVLFDAIVERAGAREVLVSDGGVRLGLALELLDRRPPEP